MKQAIQYTIRNIDPRLDKAIKKEALKADKSVNQLVVELLELSIQGNTEVKHHDLDFLVGSWVKDANQDHIFKDQRKIDEDLWS